MRPPSAAPSWRRGFLLSWGAETAEQHIAQGLILAVVALVTVLPEYAVDLYYAYKAGLEGPQSQYVHYAAANMTGANRLLVGLAWPFDGVPALDQGPAPRHRSRAGQCHGDRLPAAAQPLRRS